MPPPKPAQDIEDEEDYYGDDIPLDDTTEMMISSDVPAPSSSYGSDISLDDATLKLLDSSEPADADIEKTPLEKFRNGILDIADFTGPSYCNYKVSFSSFRQVLIMSSTCKSHHSSR